MHRRGRALHGHWCVDGMTADFQPHLPIGIGFCCKLQPFVWQHSAGSRARSACMHPAPLVGSSKPFLCC